MPGAGPILLFDKSVLQSLTVDEAVWLDTFYFPCITPLFFTETLADLEKEVQKGRSAEDVVGNLAEKTPIGGAINVHHHTLPVNELLGYTFELRHAPVVPGASPVNTRDGRRAVVYDSPPQAAALSRWQARDFLEVERLLAQTDRSNAITFDHDDHVSLESALTLCSAHLCRNRGAWRRIDAGFDARNRTVTSVRRYFANL